MEPIHFGDIPCSAEIAGRGMVLPQVPMEGIILPEELRGVG